MNLEISEEAVKEALSKTSELVTSVEERYREAAFPIVLQALLVSPTTSGGSSYVPKQLNDVNQAVETIKLSPQLSIGEFFHKLKADSHTTKVVCCAYFLLHVSKTEQFATTDILELYTKSRQTKPTNLADIIGKCIKKGHITQTGNSASKDKSWVITATGDEFVEGLLNDNAK